MTQDESLEIPSLAIHLEEWTRHFEHEYIIKLTKNIIKSWKTNEWSQCFLKRYCSLSVESNAEFNQGLTLFRQTQTLSRRKHLHKYNNKFFRHFINAWLHFMKIINKFPLTKNILYKPIFWTSNQSEN